MRLLNVRTRQLEKFEDEKKIYGRYAILSHVWEDEEVTFQDMRAGNAQQRQGYAKIESACQQALSEGMNYLWADTCCIDKTSSAELSEAINSMYRWYYEAKVCYAYLYDVPSVPLKKSRWFTRGWTLQELIAPGFLEFYDSFWRPIGSKIELLSSLADITHIDFKVLRDRTTLQTTSVAARMAWASHRITTRIEDVAYSLMGIFDVNMPMIYGEGPKAFARLQEEIIKTYEDPSILTWQAWEQSQASMLLSPSPYGFRNAHGILSWSYDGLDDSFALNNKGLRMYLPTIEDERDPMLVTAILNCRYQDVSNEQIALLLRKHPPGMVVPRRELKSTVCEMAPQNNSKGTYTSLRNLQRKHLPSAQWTSLMILKSPTTPETTAPAAVWTQRLKIRSTVSQLELHSVSPKEAYDSQDKTITLVITGSKEHDRAYMLFSEPSETRRRPFFSLAFGQEINSGRAEPRVWLTRHSNLPDSASAVFGNMERAGLLPQQCAKTEFKRGVCELVARVEKDRQLNSSGELEWTIVLSLETYTHSFRESLGQLMQSLDRSERRAS